MKKPMKKTQGTVGGKDARGVKDKTMSKAKRTFPPSDAPSMPQAAGRNALGR